MTEKFFEEKRLQIPSKKKRKGVRKQMYNLTLLT